MTQAGPPWHETAAALDGALAAGYRVIAVIDGALVDDLGEALEQIGIWARPLLGRTVPRAQRDAGPWMVFPDLEPPDPLAGLPAASDPETLTARLAEAATKAAKEGDEDSALFGRGRPVPLEPKPTRRAWAQLLERHATACPVIWAFPAGTGDGAMRSHLRGLNLVRLARRPRPRHPAPRGHEEVAFRHADGRVLAAIAALLRPDQVARLMGPAAGVLMATPQGSLSLVAEDTPPADPDIPLTLDAAQVDRLEEPRYAPLDEAIAARIAGAGPTDVATATRLRDLRRTVIARTPFRADQHICDLVEIMWHLGPGILDRGDVVDLLDRPGWSQERRCVTLRRRLLPGPPARPDRKTA